MGVDRVDIRTPPNTSYAWGAQINACKNLLISISQTFKGGTRLGTLPQSSNPFGVNESGFYVDNSGGFWGVYNGSPTSLTGGGASTGNWTFSLNNADLTGAGTMGLALTTATALSIGNSSFTNLSLTASRFNMTQRALTSGTQTQAFLLTGGAHTALTASAELIDFNVNLNRTVQFSTGNIVTQRASIIQPPTYGFVGASTITNAYTLAISGAPKVGTNATLTNTSALGLFTGADAANALTLVPNSSTQSGAMWRSLDASGNVLSSMQMTDAGQSNQLNLTSQLNGGYSFMNVTTAGGSFPIIFQNNSGILLASSSASDFRFYSSSFSTLLAQIAASGIHCNRFSPVASQTIAFSATPAFDATAGNFIDFGPVTGNVTGPTMVSGQAGEKCTIVMRKDATGGTYTVATSWGSNVRMDSTALAFTSGSGSLVVLSFVWDDRLSTPAWVEKSRKAFN